LFIRKRGGAFMPEFQCTEVNVVEPSCFDIYKLKAMEQVSQEAGNQAFYLRELGKVSIEICAQVDVMMVLPTQRRTVNRSVVHPTGTSPTVSVPR